MIIKEDLKDISPIVVRKSIRAGLKIFRKMRNRCQYSLGGKILVMENIVECLKGLGIQEGDTVLVHSSLSRLGTVEGGAQTVVEALMNAVGISGTVGAPTFWGNTGLYLDGHRTFDVRNSPSILGAISENIRKRPDARRSLHPTHSAAFIGPQAGFLTEHHQLDNTPIGGKNSPFMKLIDLQGKIILLGVTLEYLTSFHTIEDIPGFPVKVYLDDPLAFRVIDENSSELAVSTYCLDPKVGRKAKGIKMGRYLRENGLLQELRLGNATVCLLPARPLHEVLLFLYGKGITMYSPGY